MTIDDAAIYGRGGATGGTGGFARATIIHDGIPYSAAEWDQQLILRELKNIASKLDEILAIARDYTDPEPTDEMEEKR